MAGYMYLKKVRKVLLLLQRKVLTRARRCEKVVLQG